MSALSCFFMLILHKLKNDNLLFVQNHTQAVAQYPCSLQMSFIFCDFWLFVVGAWAARNWVCVENSPPEGTSLVATAGLGWQQGGHGGLALLVVAALGTQWEPCERRNRAWPRCSTHLQWLMVYFGNNWQVHCFLQQNCKWWLRLGISGSSAGRGHVCVLASWAPALCRVTVQVSRCAAGSLGFAGKSRVRLPAAVVVHMGLLCCAVLCHAVPSLHPVGQSLAPKRASQLWAQQQLCCLAGLIL